MMNRDVGNQRDRILSRLREKNLLLTELKIWIHFSIV